MKILIDTNIILDVLYNRETFVDDSLKVLKCCEVKQVEGYICALSIPNIVYIMRKELDNNKIQELITKLTTIFNVVDLRATDLIKASNADFTDYEDALQATCASRINASYIITRNIKDFESSPVPAIKPSEFLGRI